MLAGNPARPKAVQVAAQSLGFADAVERITLNVANERVDSLECSPVFRLPSTPTSATALRIPANALVATEKTAQCIYERQLRPLEKQHQPWLDRVIAQQPAAYDLVEADMADASGGCLDGHSLDAG